MRKKKERLKIILKFDTGADGFEKMICVLAIGAVAVLMCGTYFLLFEYKKILP